VYHLFGTLGHARNSLNELYCNATSFGTIFIMFGIFICMKCANRKLAKKKESCGQMGDAVGSSGMS
jgi:hypothetical protein